jgi:hypothetical protein
MPRHDHPGAAVLLEPSHRSQPRLQTAVVSLDPVVGILLGPMPGRRQQLLQQDRIDRCPVGDDLDRRGLGSADGPLEEPAGCLDIAAGRDEDVDDLPELVDRSVYRTSARARRDEASVSDVRSGTRRPRLGQAGPGPRRSAAWPTSDCSGARPWGRGRPGTPPARRPRPRARSRPPRAAGGTPWPRSGAAGGRHRQRVSPGSCGPWTGSRW